MDCIAISTFMDRRLEGRRLSAAQNASLTAHLTACEDCRHAWTAVQALHRQRMAPAPSSPSALAAGALATASYGHARPRKRRLLNRAGAVLAACFLLAAFVLTTVLRSPVENGAGEFGIALHETRNVALAIDAPEAVEAAQIRVAVAGDIALAGYKGQAELRWSTSLGRGVNVLELPIRMRSRTGGEVLVEVSYGRARKTFVVRVHSTERPEAIPNV